MSDELDLSKDERRTLRLAKKGVANIVNGDPLKDAMDDVDIEKAVILLNKLAKKFGLFKKVGTDPV